MPLVGIVDPSHTELEQDQPGRFPSWKPIDAVLQEAREQDPKWSPWTYELLYAMLGEFEERDYISVTMLVGGCPRSKVLERKEEYVATAYDFYAALRGTLIHRTLEFAARPGSLAEARFHTTVEETLLSCSPDLLAPTTQGLDLYDYKFTENPPSFNYPWRDHTLQVQYNMFVVRHAEKMTDCPDPSKVGVWRAEPQRSATLVYLGPKGPKPITVEKKQPWTTPAGKEVQRNQPYIWSDEEVLEGYPGKYTRPGVTEPGLVQRIQAMETALEAYPELPPEVAEVWGGDADDYRCPGPPLCWLPHCLAKRYPDGLRW